MILRFYFFSNYFLGGSSAFYFLSQWCSPPAILFLPGAPLLLISSCLVLPSSSYSLPAWCSPPPILFLPGTPLLQSLPTWCFPPLILLTDSTQLSTFNIPENTSLATFPGPGPFLASPQSLSQHFLWGQHFSQGLVFPMGASISHGDSSSHPYSMDAKL